MPPTDLSYWDAAPRGEKQDAVQANALRKGYKNNPTMLVVGAVEELGEVAREVLLDDPNYVSKPGKECGDLRHEIIDVFVYLIQLANHYGIDLGV